MQNEDTDAPIVISIKKSLHKDFKNLKEDASSPLSKRENKDIFILAMCIGFRKGSCIHLLEQKEGVTRFEYLSDTDKNIINTLAVHREGSLDVLLNKRKVYAIAEGYASGGIPHLKDMVFSGSYGNFIKKLEAELYDEIDKIDNASF